MSSPKVLASTGLVMMLVWIDKKRRHRTSQLTDATHEARNALHAARLCAEETGRPDDSLGTQLERIELALDEIGWLSLGQVADHMPRACEPVGIDRLIERRAFAWEQLARASGKSLKVADVPPAMVQGNPQALSRALDNLVSNALRHGGNSVLLAARVEQGEIHLCIDDGGPGPPVALDKAHRRASSEKHGHGLGIARRTVEASGGSLHAQPSGVLVRMPLRGQQAQSRLRSAR